MIMIMIFIEGIKYYKQFDNQLIVRPELAEI